MSLIYFSHRSEFREWLATHHLTEKEVFVGYYKVVTGKPSMTWSDSVDEALCFGWIDSIRKTIDSESYSIRFTPRKPNSIWSEVNINKVEQLIREGLMREAGLEAYSKRKNEKSGISSFENDKWKLDETIGKLFRENTDAWTFFTNQAPSYQKNITHWILSAKQEKTRFSRLEKAIVASAGKRKIF